MKKMMLMLLTVAVFAGCSSCHFDYKQESRITESRKHVKDFEKIEMLGSMDVTYMQGDSFEVKVEAPKDVVDKVETEVKNHKLLIRMKGTNHLFHFGNASSDDVKVTVMSPDLIGVKLNGSGDFECVGLLDTDVLDINLVGSGDVEFKNVICDQINVKLVGSGDVDVEKVRTLMSTMELVGSGDIKMKFDDAKMVDARLVGSGDITLYGNVETFTSSAHGSGELNIDKLKVMNNKK